jgi:hypothetical protein
MFFGYEDSAGSNRTGWGLRDRITAKDYYIGLYGVRVFCGGSDLRTVFNFGWQNYRSQRTGNDGRLYRTAFSGNTAEVNVEWGRRHYFDGGRGALWSVRPSVALDWYLIQLHGGVETPRTEHAIRYSSTNFSQLLFRFGADLRYERGRGAIEGGIFYSYDLRGSELWTRASSVDGTNLHSSLVSSNLGRSILSFNLGASYLLGNNFTVFGGYRGEVIPGQAGRGFISTAYAGGAWRW